MTYYLKDDDPIPGSDLAGYVADKCDEVEQLRAINAELLEALKEVVGYGSSIAWGSAYDDALDVIAKAEGE